LPIANEDVVIISFKAEFEQNPPYDPNPDPDVNWIYKIGTKYKYYKDHANSHTIGLSLMTKLEYLIAPYAGMEFESVCL